LLKFSSFWQFDYEGAPPAEEEATTPAIEEEDTPTKEEGEEEATAEEEGEEEEIFSRRRTARKIHPPRRSVEEGYEIFLQQHRQVPPSPSSPTPEGRRGRRCGASVLEARAKKRRTVTEEAAPSTRKRRGRPAKTATANPTTPKPPTASTTGKKRGRTAKCPSCKKGKKDHAATKSARRMPKNSRTATDFVASKDATS
jgi:hypothetical protein